MMNRGGIRKSIPKGTGPLLWHALLNFIVMVVVITFGFATGSLGLLCEGVHMAISSGAILMSIWALQYSTKDVSLGSSYGYSRVHVVVAFCNATVIGFVAMLLIVEASRRFVYVLLIYDLDEQWGMSQRDYILGVATLGLVSDLIGFLLLNKSGMNAVSFAPEWFPEHVSRKGMVLNLESLILHATCDIFISFGVILTSILFSQEWKIVDPLIAFIIALIIIRSIVPMLSNASGILLQATPDSLRNQLDSITREISVWNGVLECSHEHAWVYAPGTQIVTLRIRIRHDANEEHILIGANQIMSVISQFSYVQIDKDHHE